MKRRVEPHLLLVRRSLISAGPVFTGFFFLKERKRLDSEIQIMAYSCDNRQSAPSSPLVYVQRSSRSFFTDKVLKSPVLILSLVFFFEFNFKLLDNYYIAHLIKLDV